VALIDCHHCLFLRPAGERRIDNLHVVTGTPGHRGDAQQADGRTRALHDFERVDADIGKRAAQRHRFDQPCVGWHE